MKKSKNIVLCVSDRMIFQVVYAKFQKLKMGISNIKLSYKLMLAFIAVTFVPIISLGIFSYYRISNTIMHDNRNAVIAELNQITLNMNNLFNAVIGISQDIYTNRELNEFLKTSYNDDIKLFDAYSNIFYPKIQNIFINYKMVKDILFYTTNENILLESLNIVVVKADEYPCDFKNNYDKKLIWKSTFIERGKPLFSLYRVMNYFSAKKISGVVRLDIFEEFLYNFIKEEPSNKRIIVIDENGNVVTSTSRELIGENIKEFDFVAQVLSSEEKSGYFIYLEGINKYTIVYNTLNNRWKIFALVNMDELLKGTRNVSNVIICVCAGIVVLLMLLARYLSARLTYRINSTIEKMREIEKGNTDIILEESHDEIGMLNRSFNIMIKKLNNIIKENYIINLKKREAQIEALQSQINPHFLFNTLESIRMKLVKNNDIDTAKIIRILARLFRTKLNFEEALIPLKEEIGIVEDYIKIQIYRFGERIGFKNNIDSKFLSYMIPKLTIQPLVENAIIHGLEKKDEGGVVILDATYEGDFFKIIVSDNGYGMDRCTLKAVQNALDKDFELKRATSIGIVNVHERLQLYFGEKYGLKIKSDLMNGTSVEVYLPRGDKFV